MIASRVETVEQPRQIDPHQSPVMLDDTTADHGEQRDVAGVVVGATVVDASVVGVAVVGATVVVGVAVVAGDVAGDAVVGGVVAPAGRQMSAPG